MKLNKLPVPHRDYCQKQFRLLNYLMSQRCTLETILSILRDEKNTRTGSSRAQPGQHNLDIGFWFTDFCVHFQRIYL